jgi:site-specific DNA-methyltransferase (adenine-specific)
MSNTVRVEQIGRATLILGDSLEQISDLPTFDALISDPPYSSGGLHAGDRALPTSRKYQQSKVLVKHPDFAGDNRDQRSFFAWSTLWLGRALDRARPGSIAAVFTDWRQLPTTTDAVQAAGWTWRGVVPWDKLRARPMPNRFRAQCEYVVWGTSGARPFANDNEPAYHPGIFSESPPGRDRVHSTQKPVGVMRQLCLAAPAGGVVCDPFMGSGTTGVAALLEGRQFIGIEKDPEIFERACARIREAAA